MKLDLKYRNSQRGFTKQFGMSNLVFALEKKLSQTGVFVHKSTHLSSIKSDNYEQIESIIFTNENKKIKLDQISLLHSTIASNRLLPFFNLKTSQNPLDKKT